MIIVIGVIITFVLLFTAGILDAGYMAMFASFLPAFFSFWLHHHINVTRKPILSTKARLVKKDEFGAGGGVTYYWTTFLLQGKTTAELRVSRKQFDILRINDVVELVYKGTMCISFQRPVDKSPIMNKNFRVKQK
jgi:hypothetical protein